MSRSTWIKVEHVRCAYAYLWRVNVTPLCISSYIFHSLISLLLSPPSHSSQAIVKWAWVGWMRGKWGQSRMKCDILVTSGSYEICVSVQPQLCSRWRIVSSSKPDYHSGICCSHTHAHKLMREIVKCFERFNLWLRAQANDHFSNVSNIRGQFMLQEK